MATIFRDRIQVQHVSYDGSEVLTTTFNEYASRPVAGLVEWEIDILDPWSNTAELSGDFAKIQAVDGEIPGDFFTWDGKQYLISGYVHAEDRATAEDAWDVIVRDAFPRNVDLTIVRDGPVPKYTVVRLNARCENKWVGPTAFRWSVEARAYDPFRYAVTPMEDFTGVAGSLQVGRGYPRSYPLSYGSGGEGAGNKIEFNVLGTEDTKRIVIRLAGPLVEGAWRIANETTGDYLRVGVGVPEGSSLVLDFLKESATLNGTPVTARIDGTYFSLKAGKVNTLRLIADYDDDAFMQVTAYSAWA